ncbi:uncharacterized protein BO80DRAFT_424889 [Aspergillus ibericus CBS 121593]|uniref:Uncharacterized protein n=1 Tax=Aspergillus ibericus CBS 121593 TaxID=1448316 RepID=A0A395H0H5_9EURO|nr:hypothetical protein BO80DRAFT_424889 [Aspergillus ibericus CBS 121593]RAL01337.1 hypothetical protein BO80DRAFT_424889 [Aspergillus ibericus CBS 121593]
MDTNTPTLSDHITHLATLPLHARIEALHALTPNLTPTISPTGTRLITHPSYTGYAHLDPLGTLYLTTAWACTEEHAPLTTRLLHADLDPIFESIYVSSEDQLLAGRKDGTVVIPKPDENNEPVGCACCRGDPDALILAGFETEGAFYFFEEEYRALWGDEPEHGMMYSPSIGRRLAASRAQIKGALQREREREREGKVVAVL